MFLIKSRKIVKRCGRSKRINEAMSWKMTSLACWCRPLDRKTPYRAGLAFISTFGELRGTPLVVRIAYAAQRIGRNVFFGDFVKKHPTSTAAGSAFRRHMRSMQFSSAQRPACPAGCASDWASFARGVAAISARGLTRSNRGAANCCARPVRCRVGYTTEVCDDRIQLWRRPDSIAELCWS